MKKKYTSEFKREAVELGDSLNNYSRAAKQLGISDCLIHSWKKRKLTTSNLNRNIKILSDSELENQKLRKENMELKKVNHILKAAAAFFSQDHLK